MIQVFRRPDRPPAPADRPHAPAARAEPSSQPRRVLLLSGSMEGGGSERQTLLLLEHLDRRRFAPELYLTYRRGELLSEVPADVPVHAFDDTEPELKLNWPGRKHRRMVRHLRTLIGQRGIDVVYDRTFHMTLVAGPATRGLVGRVSTIVSPPDRDLTRNEPRFLAAKRRRLAAAYRQSRIVLAVSEAVRRAAIEFYDLPPDAVETLRNPLDLAGLRCRAAIDPGVPLESGQIHVACIGRMTWEKGQDLLIEAMARIDAPQLMLWLVGDGPLRGALERQAAELGVADRVRFTGHLKDAVGLLARCDLLVCPSRYEGLPNVVLEAFGLGVPVIAADAGGTRELVRDAETGRLVPAGDAGALSRAVGEWLEARRGGAVPAGPLEAAAAELVEREYNLVSYLERLQNWLEAVAT
ncbi:glycosyltransferase [Candidatus Laterigemmans baculatus]|uniref:glycosyltransferase n=1 Tax=Candidatus Laterigemmans baculatus TaxID=2770505 RepID=UPI0013DCA1CA|nr:glycosyltransferase [Candidatus Laterigemmans baculatus]